MIETRTKVLERVLVSTGQGDAGGVMVAQATMLIGVLKGGVTGLNDLLRAGEIAARDGVKVGFLGRIYILLASLVDLFRR